jgi:hypothetical protein
VKEAMTKLMGSSRRFEQLVRRMDRLAQFHTPQAQKALDRLEAKLRDLVFSRQDLIDHLGERG